MLGNIFQKLFSYQKYVWGFKILSTCFNIFKYFLKINFIFDYFLYLYNYFLIQFLKNNLKNTIF